MSSLCGKIVELVRLRGVAGIGDLLVHACAEFYNEWRLGITTTHWALERAGLPKRVTHWYGAVPYRAFRKAMGSIEITPWHDVFLDCGAGMGRACILAAMYPFAKVIGVEVLPELVDICRQNIAKVRHRLQCKRIEVVMHDAVSYKLPDEVTVLYLFNPFHGTGMKAVFEAVRSSLVSTPRPFTVMFLNTRFFQEELRQYSWLTRVNAFTFSFASAPRGLDCVILKADPDRAASVTGDNGSVQ